MHINRRLILFAFFLLIFCNASAWGGMGHKIVVEIAKRHLTEKAKKNILALAPYDITLDADWMDKHRKDPELEYAYHYHELCIDLKTLKYDPNPLVAKGDMMRALCLADYNLSRYREIPDSEEPKIIPDDFLDNVKDILTMELVKGGCQLAFLLNKYFDR